MRRKLGRGTPTGLAVTSWMLTALVSAVVASWWLLGDQSAAPEARDPKAGSEVGGWLEWPIGAPAALAAGLCLVRALGLRRQRHPAAVPIAIALAVGSTFGWMARLVTARVSGANFAVGYALVVVPCGVLALAWGLYHWWIETRGPAGREP
jgi:hypothetical protein